MEKKRETNFYRMNIRIDSKLAELLKRKADIERVSINYLLSEIIHQNVSCAESQQVLPIVINSELKELLEKDAKSMKVTLNEYILLKLMSK